MVKKSETAVVGVGDQEALYAGEILVFGGFQNGGPWGGGPGRFGRWRILRLFELIYGYKPNFRKR